MAKRDIYNSYVFHQTSPYSEYSGIRTTYGSLFNFCIFKHSMSIESLSKPSGMLNESKCSKQSKRTSKTCICTYAFSIHVYS